ncbi:MAG TPA: response regulator/pilus assembly protein [Dehalococcoidia bacterium]|nr:response regulator/pilus assembly protein [Dehalococcoidia bacterium]
MPKILVVDDDPAGQRLIKYMLTPEGYEVITASNGILGLQMATQQSPDLVVLDIMLPGLDGFEVCRRLREGSNTENISIVMLSGKSQETDRDTGLKMGADAYLIKPVDRQELIDTVNKLVHERIGVVKQRQGNIVTLIGARGGVGTSTISTNVSIALADKGYSTLLVDLSPSFSILADMMGLTVEHSAAGLFKGTGGVISPSLIKELIVDHPSGVKLLWADVFPEEYGSMTRENVDQLMQETGNLSKFVIVDVPASPSDHAVAALTAADIVVLVVGAAKESLERIDTSVTRLSRFGVNRTNMKLILVDRSGNVNNRTVSSVSGLPVLGFVHYCDSECAEAEAKNTPVILSSPLSKIAEDINIIATEISKFE